MKAIVLVGGEGTRLRPLTLSTPKQMLPLLGQPMIERVLSQLKLHGIDEAVLSLGYLPDAFRSAYPSGQAAGLSLSYAVEPTPLDTAGAVRFAAEFADIDDTFVVVNGDVLTDLNVRALIEFHREHGAQGTIALKPVADPSAFGVVPTDEKGRVIAFVEKPSREDAPSDLINAGTYVLEPAVLERIPKGRRVSIERETFPQMVRDGLLFALPEDTYWLDAGTPAAYLQAHMDYLDGKRRGPIGSGLVEIGVDLWVEGNPLINGEVSGPCAVFSGANIAEGARIERSVLGAGSCVEQGATVIDSILMPGARVAQRSKVVGSILGPRSTVGERCELRSISVLGADVVVPSGSLIEGERVPS